MRLRQELIYEGRKFTLQIIFALFLAFGLRNFRRRVLV